MIDGSRSDEWEDRVDRRLEDLERGHLRMSEAIADNTTTTNLIKNDTTELIQIFKAFDGARTLTKWMGKVVLWSAGILVALAVIWNHLRQVFK